MKLTQSAKILLIAAALTVDGCSSILSRSAVPTNQPLENTPDTLKWIYAKPDTTILRETIIYDESETEDSLEPPSNGEWANLSNQTKLDSAAKLLDAALTMREEGDLIVAEYYYYQAKGILQAVNTEDLEIVLGQYHTLMQNLENFHLDYIAQFEELPEEMTPEAVLAGVELAEGDTSAGEAEPDELAEMEIDTTSLAQTLLMVKPIPPVPLDLDHPKVQKAILFFQGKGRKVFEKWLERAEYQVGPMQQILREEGLPEELVYLAMIESGFNPKAYSYAHASGPWQFIRSTGKIFGLKITWWYDERRDPVKSTYAAAKYLKKLYYDFEDWYLAMAAYNCGEGKIERHTRRYNTRDYWKLNRIPRQTRNYVPTYIAAAAIAMNPAEYGFEDFVLKNPLSCDSVLVQECIDLILISDIVDTTFEYIKELNPCIVRWCTPPDVDSVWIKIPAGKVQQYYAKIDSIPPDQKRSWVRHKVRRGETLSIIARKYGTTEKAIMDISANNIRSKHRISAGQYLLIPVPPQKYRAEWAASEPDEIYFSPESGEKTYYTVRRGDNLSGIAVRFGVTVSRLKQWNNLWGKRFIYPGQKLVIWREENTNSESGSIPDRSKSLHSSGGGSSGTNHPKFHRVQSGESLWQIAEKYHISAEELKRLNGLSGSCIIKPGDELLLTPNASIRQSIHIVRRGDTLWEIADAYGVRLSDLKRENGLTNTSVIKPGDRLKIPN